jgi:hypothetical protein
MLAPVRDRPTDVTASFKVAFEEARDRGAGDRMLLIGLTPAWRIGRPQSRGAEP